MTLHEYIEECKTRNVFPFIDMAYIPTNVLLISAADDTYIVRTTATQQKLTMWADIHMGNRELNCFIDQGTFEEIRERILYRCECIYGVEDYEIKGLYATTQLDYNPIDNVAEKSYRVTFGTLKEKHYEQIGQQVTTNSDVNNSTVGSEVRNYDTTDFVNSGKDLVDSQETDSTSNTARVNRNIQDKHNDEGSHEQNDSHTEIVDRNGNIGVTATQQLIKMERECVQFNFYKYVANKIAKSITQLVRGL